MICGRARALPLPLMLAASAALLVLACGCRRRIEVVSTLPAVQESVEIEKPPYINFEKPPTVVSIPGTGVSYLKECEKEEIYGAGRKWYWFYKGHWFVGDTWEGPWLATTDVSGELLKIPRDHPRYRIVKHHPDYKKR